MKQLGKVGKRRQKGMEKAAPIVCERAGGSWNGWTGERCVGAMCEICGCAGWWYPLAHIQGRGVGGDERPDNLANLCLHHHDRLDNGSEEERRHLRAILEIKIARSHEKEHGG